MEAFPSTCQEPVGDYILAYVNKRESIEKWIPFFSYLKSND